MGEFIEHADKLQETKTKCIITLIDMITPIWNSIKNRETLHGILK